MKLCFTILAVLALSTGAFAQNGYVQVGNGTAEVDQPWWGTRSGGPITDHAISWLYLSSEMGSARTFYEIAFQNASSGVTEETFNNVSIHIWHTSNTSSWQLDNPPAGNLRLFATSLTVGSTGNDGWETFTLDTPFEYNGTQSVIVRIHHNGGSATVQTRSFNISGRGGFSYNSSTGSGNQNHNHVPNTRFLYATPNPVPVLNTATPDEGNAFQTLNVVLGGSNFVDDVTTVDFGPGIDVNDITYTNETSLTANVTITGAAALGPRDVTVTNPAPGGGSATLENGFTVQKALPVLTSIEPVSKPQGSAEFTMIVRGSGFYDDTEVRFDGAGRTTTFLDSEVLLATIPATDLTDIGTYDITAFTIDISAESDPLSFGVTEAVDPGEPEPLTYELYIIEEGDPLDPNDPRGPTVVPAATGLDVNNWTHDGPALDPLTTYLWDVKAIRGPHEKWSTGSFAFTTGEEAEPIPGDWVEMDLLPRDEGDRRDAVGRGSWLAYDAASDLIYAAKGQRNHEVYVFNPAAGENGEWLTEPLAEIPMDTIRPRPVDRGGRGVVVDGYLYVIHGNNTSLFWRLPLGGNGTAEENPWTPWERLEDVPLENSGRPVRGGGDLVYDATENAIYLLKGDRTDFLSYDIGSGEWTVLANAPAAPPRWLRDSWLAVDETGTIYAHKARYFDRTEENRNLWAHYMYTFDGTWSEEMTGMPLLGPVGRRLRRRRAGEGSSGTFQGGNLYALKGGNTQQLWQYDIAGEAWEHLDEMPLVGEDGRRRINAGGYLISAGEGTLYALKGNRSNQFWRYTLPTTGMVASAPRPDRSGVMSDELPTGQASVRIGPNPLNGGFATLRYNLPQAGPAQVNVFDVTGRNVLSRNIAASQTGSVSLDLRSLSAGIYLLQVEAEGFNGSQKLVVQR